MASAPDEFRNTNGKITGWEPELMQDVAAALGLKLEYEPTSFDSLIPGLKANRFDVAVGEMGITKARLKVVDFVSTILGNELFVVNKSSSIRVPNLRALCGRSVGTIRGSVEANLAQKQSKKCTAANKKPVELKVFRNSNQAGESLRAGRVQIFWDGSTAASYFIKQSHGAVKKVGTYGEPYPWGIAMAKGSGLQKPIQGAVQYLIDSGAYTAILKKWGLAYAGIKHAQIDPVTPR